MNREERFHRSVNVLVQAYRDGTLQTQSCAACAVGNLIADYKGFEVANDHGSWCWKGANRLAQGNWAMAIFALRMGMTYRGLASWQGIEDIESMGYTLPEMRMVEDAYEFYNESGMSTNRNATQYERLANVYDVLCQIHEVPELDRVEPNVLFVTKEDPAYDECAVKIEA